ncbi:MULTISPECIES: hypothetical protein [Nostoc]|uniref:Uncharacterized protein n=2 Tax=Nostoc TaxID=1177 RepID=A0ABR8II60_9NOSO|nr:MULTISPECIES: hypothetical protein [Nostoc]MBD2560473.1 hypothetical protein [Nostoc linckia FACHB-391]MBD2651275.1 hypothetical protein [Nostoc foliaceum FACHB-393]
MVTKLAIAVNIRRDLVKVRSQGETRRVILFALGSCYPFQPVSASILLERSNLLDCFS